MLVPLAFGIGSGLTTLVGVAVGANPWQRAVRATWTGGLISFFLIGTFGWIVAVVPEGWARLFTDDPQVVAATVGYITHVAPFYCLFAMGMTINFACQGAGRMTTPLVAGVARLILATGGGWLASERLGLGLDGVFAAIAGAMLIYGLLIAVPLLVKPWGPKRVRLAPTGASDGPSLNDRHLEPQPR
jgi:Na+-driven multidrug efflux pump